MSYDNCPLCGRSRSECTNIAVCCASRNEAELATLRTQLAAANAKLAEFENVDDFPVELQVKCGTFTESAQPRSEFISISKELYASLRSRLAAAQSDAAALRKGLEEIKRWLCGEAETLSPPECVLCGQDNTEAFNILRALLTPASPKGAAPGQASNDRWQDISTAPMREWVLVYTPEKLIDRIYLDYRNDTPDTDDKVYEWLWSPTHWQPLPEPPTAAETPDVKGEG